MIEPFIFAVGFLAGLVVGAAWNLENSHGAYSPQVAETPDEDPRPDYETTKTPNNPRPPSAESRSIPSSVRKAGAEARKAEAEAKLAEERLEDQREESDESTP